MFNLLFMNVEQYFFISLGKNAIKDEIAKTSEELMEKMLG